MFPEFVTPIFVPAIRSDRFGKAAESGADCIILDLEDGVAPADKNAARARIASDFTTLPVWVRINGLSSAEHAEDIEAVSRGGFAGVMLPKAERDDGFLALAQKLRSQGTPIIALIESVKGVADARSIAQTDGICRLAFGSIDFCADLQCSHTRETLLPIRMELSLASKLANIAPPLDGVTTSVADESLTVTDAQHARDLGFGGKLCIHPNQVPWIFRGFSPSTEEVDWALKVVAAPSGASSVQGAMVDEPVQKRARAILKLHERAAALSIKGA